MASWVHRYGIWLWKEWRDHRAVTVGIFLAIPGLTALAFLAFGDHLATSWLRTNRAVFLGISIGLVNFAVAAGLFAGEVRRGTMPSLRRLPGALGTAFLAKLGFLALVVIFATAWQGACLAVAEAGNGGIATDLGLGRGVDGGPLRATTLWNDILAFPTSELWLNGLGFGVVCLWTLLVSIWLGRSGVAGVGALVLLAALGTPFFLFFLAHPYFFPGPQTLAAWTIGISAFVALAAAAASLFHGSRYDGRPLRPFLAGACVLLVALGGGYAYAHVALADWLDIDPHDEDFSIYNAHVGAGARHLFLSVHRGNAWVGDSNLSAREHAQWTGKRGTPFQAWVMDLSTGALRRYRGGEGRYFMAVPELMGTGPRRSLEPSPALVCFELGADKKASAVTWWDAAAGESRRTLPPRVRDAVSLELARRTLAASTWLRDAEGRRVWLRDDVIEREGDRPELPESLTPRPERARSLWCVPGGWFGWRRSAGAAQPPKVFVDADTGEERVATPDHNVSSYGHNVISPDHTLGYLRPNLRLGDHTAMRFLIPLAGGPTVAPRNPPEEIGNVLARNRVLALRGPETGRTLHCWNPLTGDDVAVVWDGPGLSGIATAVVHGRTGDGRALLRLHAVASPRTAWAVLSADGRRARQLRTWSTRSDAHPIALLPDDALVMVEGLRRVVRYAPDGSSQVLFPR